MDTIAVGQRRVVASAAAISFDPASQIHDVLPEPVADQPVARTISNVRIEANGSSRYCSTLAASRWLSASV
jgi:hypothetical protein